MMKIAKYNYREVLQLKRLSLLLAASFALSGCLEKTEIYGGSSYDPSGHRVAKQLLSSSNLVMRFDLSNAQVNGSNQVTQVTNQVTSFTGFTGPLDLIPAAATVASIGGEWLEVFPNGLGYLQTSPSANLIFNQASVVAVLKSTSVGTLVSLHPPNDRTSEAYEVGIDSTNLTSRFLSSTGNYTESTIAVPSSADQNLIVVASFDNLLSNYLSVNGALAAEFQTTGTPVAMTSGTRVIALGSSLPGDLSYFKELYVFDRALTLAEMGAMIRYVARQNNMTNLTLDPKLGGSGSTVTPFTAAQRVIEQKCAGCHFHSNWNGVTSSYYVSQGLVSAGNLAASKVYYRLTDATEGPGPRTMPSSGSLTPAEVQAISDWISGL